MSDAPAFIRTRPVALGFYALAALAAVFELGVLWLALHPDPPKDYADFFIYNRTTCLNQPKSGPYVMGTRMGFTSETYSDAAAALRVCGWDGPAGDGLHSVGTTARLRLTFAPVQTALALTLDLTAVDKGQGATQRVTLTVNGAEIGETTLGKGETRRVTLEVPKAALDAEPGTVDLVLGFPDAVRVGPDDPDSRKRAIKLLSLHLTPFLT